MKKPVLALLATCCLVAALALSACGTKAPSPSTAAPASAPQSTPASVPQSTPAPASQAPPAQTPVPGNTTRPGTSTPDASPPGDADGTIHPVVTIGVQYSDGNNLIEIPQIYLSNGDSSQLTDEMNIEIENFVNGYGTNYPTPYYEYIDGTRQDQWMHLRCFVIDDADSLQVVLHKAIYPSPAYAGEVFSLVYGKELGMLVNLSDAMTVTEFDPGQLMENFPGLTEAQTVTGLNVGAYYVADNEAVFLLDVYIDSTVGQSTSWLYRYSPEYGTLERVDDHTHVVPSQYLLHYNPPLAWES